MTMTEEIKRRIELKQQLIKITEQEIKDLEDDLNSKSGKYETMILKIGFVCLGCGKFMSLRPKDPEETKSEVVLTDKGDGKEV